jgi:Putative porin
VQINLNLHKIFFTKCIFIIVLINICIVCNAQRNFQERSSNNKAPKDSSAGKLSRKHEHIDMKVSIYFTTFYNKQKQYIDTSIQLFHRDRYVNSWQQNLGNIGSAVYNTKITLPEKATRQLGFANLYLPYCEQADSAQFFNTTKPYTEFWYRAGGKREQSGQFIHTQNFGAENNFSFRYTKYGAPGYFNYQSNSHDHLATSLEFHPTNFKRFSTKIAFAVNQIRQDENGGILDDSLLYYGNYSLRTTIPVLFETSFLSSTKSAVTNYYRRNELLMHNFFTLGFKKNTDSAAAKQAGLQLIHVLRIEGEKQIFKDKDAIIENYKTIDTFSLLPKDSVNANTRLQTIQNEIGGLLPNIAKGKILVNANLGFEVQTLKNINATNTYYSNYVKGNIQSNNELLLWQYGANLHFYFLGNAIGNYNVNAFMATTIKNLQIKLFANQNLNTAAYNQLNYVSNKYSLNNSFDKILNTSIGGELKNVEKKYSVVLKNSTSVNYVYWDTTLRAKQNNNIISMLQLEAIKQFTYKHWMWHQSILFQQFTSNAPWNAPPLALHTTLSYTNKIFKKTTLASIGIDAYYNVSYKTPNYEPLIGQYVFANQYIQNNLPRVGAFFNSKIKRFRVFITADELIQNIDVKNRILVKGYPATDFIFRAGFSWIMVN